MDGGGKVDHHADGGEGGDDSCREGLGDLLEVGAVEDVAASAEAEVFEIAVDENNDGGEEAGEEGEGVGAADEALAEVELSRARHHEIEEHGDLHGFGTAC